MATIGIPRALYWHYQGRLWEAFFKNLGFEVVVSPEGNKQIVEKGVENSDINLCFAVKIYVGHFMDLMNKSDMIFVPSVMGNKQLHLCAYHKALPEMMKIQFPDIRIIKADLKIGDKLSDKSKQELIDLGVSLGKNESEVRESLNNAIESWKKDKEKEIENNERKLKQDDKIKIAIIGAKYILNDRFCSGDIINLLEKEGVEPVFINSKENCKSDFKICWDLEQEVINQYAKAVKNEKIAGIIYVAPFTCGPLFLIEEQVIDDRKKLLNLKVDESQHEARLKTRIEAFVDLLKR